MINHGRVRFDLDHPQMSLRARRVASERNPEHGVVSHLEVSGFSSVRAIGPYKSVIVITELRPEKGRRSNELFAESDPSHAATRIVATVALAFEV